ncbi:MAG: hypothetical protein AUJ18_04150 [Candidatus Hydrogenedentes bacterium CG1_02_42_14]|nr:MAG: hypothetical protein AUJ18_04150 [Candidatus Hydrogenedentes bacterium CG1_02_42_14]
MNRIHSAEATGCPAVGVDIDASAFVTMKAKGQAVAPKSESELKKIISECSIPFIVKGIMTVEDAKKAVSAGAKAVIVGNHGGRVMDFMAGGADALVEIVSELKKTVPIILDGGIRSGEDVLKALALGADLCMIGRPLAIAAVGGGREGVELYWNQLRDELERVMILTGTESIDSVSPKILRKVQTG